MQRCTILINGRAGLRQNTAGPDELRRLVRELDLDAEVVETKSPDQMCDCIRTLQRGGAEMVAVAGGDGTIHEAVQCLALTETALAILPQGTRNNFAHALGLPLDLQSALQLLRDGQIIEVDVGKSKGGFFTEAAGVGLFADALAHYGPNNKSFWHGVAAIWKVFFTMRPKRLRLTLDGKVLSERAVMCTVANSYRIGASAAVAPGASVTDGKLDVIVLGDLSRFELVPYYKAVKRGTHIGLPKVSQHQAREIKIEAAIPLNLHVDDQVVGETPATVRVVPGSLKVLVKKG